jgi:hypothetical protein
MKGSIANSVNTLLTLLATFGATVATADSAVPARQRPGQDRLFKAAPPPPRRTLPCIAALLLQAQPGSTPQQINTALETSAIDMNGAGFDHQSGFGLIQADAAIAAILGSGSNNLPTAGFRLRRVLP